MLKYGVCQSLKVVIFARSNSNENNTYRSLCKVRLDKENSMLKMIKTKLPKPGGKS
jgi:hypothetical protein